MKKPPDSSSERTGTPGLDIFKIAGQSISGYIPSLKTGNTRAIRCPYTSILEQMLALYLEYHPQVSFYQRGDASEAFARARHLHTPLGTPYPISYLYEDQPHEYLPDYVGKLYDGSLLIAEAGLEEQKSKGQSLAKAEAARRLAQLKGGIYWVGTEKIFLSNVTAIYSFSIFDVKPSVPKTRLRLPCLHTGPEASSVASMSWYSGLAEVSRTTKLRRRCGNWLAMLRHKGVSSLI